MNTLPRFVVRVLRLAAVATALIVGYESFLRAFGGASAGLSPGIVLAGWTWAALGACGIGAALRSRVDGIGLGAVMFLLAVRAVGEAATGQCLTGVAPALLGFAAALTAALAHEGLPALAMAPAGLRRGEPLPSALGGPLQRVA